MSLDSLHNSVINKLQIASRLKPINKQTFMNVSEFSFKRTLSIKYIQQ